MLFFETLTGRENATGDAGKHAPAADVPAAVQVMCRHRRACPCTCIHVPGSSVVRRVAATPGAGAPARQRDTRLTHAEGTGRRALALAVAASRVAPVGGRG